MKKAKLAAMCLISTTLGFQAAAQAQWSLGAGGISTDASYRGIDRDNFVIPFIGYEGERIYFRGFEAGYRLNPSAPGTPVAERSPHEWAIVITGSPFRYRANDSDDPQMRELDNRSISAEIALDYSFRTPYGVWEARVGQDLRGNGHRFSTNYSYPLSPNPMRWQVSPSIGVDFISGGYTDHYYGISLEEAARSALPEYSSQDAFNPFIGVSGYYRFNEKWSVFAAANAARMSSKIADSPMSDDKYINSIVTAVVYSF